MSSSASSFIPDNFSIANAGSAGSNRARRRLVLAAVGLYGVTSYTVARRTSEIGIRMALGADRTNVVGMVMREAMLQAGIGLAIGIPAALLCVRFVQAQLYNVQDHDLTVFTSAILALAISTLIAGLIPARRAASTDPMTALRTE